MRNVRRAAALVFAGALAGVPAWVHAQQVHPGETQGLGLTGARTPGLLKDIAADPYRPPAEPACETIPAELMALNQVLGVDADQPKPKKSMVKKATGAIGGAVRGFIPYRGEIRFLTQADKKDHQLMDATQAAWARRGFLRGLEANLHCAGDADVDPTSAAPLPGVPDATVAEADLPPPIQAAAYAGAPGQPWQLPPPPPAHADEQAAAPADPAAVMLRDPDARGFDRPGR
jgi:hypothetical protein